jgi:hypothetical protein
LCREVILRSHVAERRRVWAFLWVLSTSFSLWLLIVPSTALLLGRLLIVMMKVRLQLASNGVFFITDGSARHSVVQLRCLELIVLVALSPVGQLWRLSQPLASHS